VFLAVALSVRFAAFIRLKVKPAFMVLICTAGNTVQQLNQKVKTGWLKKLLKRTRCGIIVKSIALLAILEKKRKILFMHLYCLN
jgi:hypothetical protein